MIIRDLSKEYPEIISVCREFDCDYESAIRIIESRRSDKTLTRYV